MNFYDVIEHASLNDTAALMLAHAAVREFVYGTEDQLPDTVRSRRDTAPVPTSPTIPAESERQ